MYTEIQYNNELYHHGVKGQKWGVRRYQNLDGSYTSAGRSRYGINERVWQPKKVAKKNSGRGRTALKVGLAIAGAALVSYGAYKLATDPRAMRAMKKVADRGKDSVSNMLKKTKPFTTSQLKSMGISVVEPETIKIDRIEIPKAKVNTVGNSKTKMNFWELPSTQKYLNENPGLKRTMLENEKAKYEYDRRMKKLAEAVSRSRETKSSSELKLVSPVNKNRTASQQKVYDYYAKKLEEAKTTPFKDVIDENDRKLDIELYKRILKNIDNM